MTVIGTDKIEEFMRMHEDSTSWLKAWLAEARSANWKSPMDIKSRYRSASILDNNRVIFNVKGNSYRMEIQVSYNNGVVAINRLGTHAEYDRWD